MWQTICSQSSDKYLLITCYSSDIKISNVSLIVPMAQTVFNSLHTAQLMVSELSQ